MLRLALTCLLIFLLGSIEAAPPNTQRNIEILEEYFYRKCTKNSDDHLAFMRLQLDAGMLNALLSYHEPRTEEEVYNAVCNPIVGYEHLDSLMTTLEPCLDTEEKYLPDFARTTYNDSKEDLCKGDKDDFIAMVDDLKNNQCVHLQRNLTTVGHNCLLDMNLDFNPDTTLTIDLVCGQLKTGRDCLIDGVKRVCTDNVFSNFLMRGFKPYVDWCEKH